MKVCRCSKDVMKNSRACRRAAPGLPLRARCSLGPGGLTGCRLGLSRLPGRKSECRGTSAGQAASGAAFLAQPAQIPLGLIGLHPECGHVATRPAPGVPPNPLHQDVLRALARSRMVQQAIPPRSQAARWAAWCAGRSRRGSASVGLSRLNSVARHRVWPATPDLASEPPATDLQSDA